MVVFCDADLHRDFGPHLDFIFRRSWSYSYVYGSQCFRRGVQVSFLAHRRQTSRRISDLNDLFLKATILTIFLHGEIVNLGIKTMRKWIISGSDLLGCVSLREGIRSIVFLGEFLVSWMVFLFKSSVSGTTIINLPYQPQHQILDFLCSSFDLLIYYRLVPNY